MAERRRASTTVRARTVLGAVALVLTAAGAATGPAQADPPVTATARPPVAYRAPVAGPPQVARRFRAPAQAWSAGHRGLDLWLDVGAPVLSPAAGTVTFAGVVVDRGVVSVLHADGRRTSLEPVAAEVAVGQSVAAGSELGTLQDAGAHCGARTCLHWGLREGDQYVDPLAMLPGSGPVVLLPLDDAG